MKFNLTVNEQHKDGFKLIFVAQDKEELATCKTLAEKLIEKITKIEVRVTDDGE